MVIGDLPHAREGNPGCGAPALRIDVLPAAATSLSLEGADDLHLVALAPVSTPSRLGERRAA